MSSRPIRRSPPLIRWKTLSSSDNRTSPVRKSFEQEKFSGISHLYEDGHSTDRLPYYSSRSKYQFSTLSADYRQQRVHPSIFSRNLKTASRSYWRHPQYNTARTFQPRKRYSPGVKSSAEADCELRSMKRMRSHEDLSDSFPFKRSKQQIERRYDSPQSRCPPEYKSGDRWHSPPCRRSKELYRDVSQNDEYGRVHISRDSATNMRKRSDNSRQTSNNHSDKEQCSTSRKHQFSDDTFDKYYKASDRKSSKDDVLQRLKRDSGSNLDLDHDDRKLFGQLNRNREKITENTRQSPLLYKQNSKGKVAPEKRAQCLQGRIKAQSPKRKHESLSEANTRRKDGTDGMQPQNRHSKDLTKSTNCSKVKPSNESDLLWAVSGNQSSRWSLSSASNSSCNSSQVSSTTVRSRESSEGKGSRDLGADIHVKAQVPEFNPDYVVIVRRHNEGERPLCSREEFSETVLKPVSDTKQDSERKNVPSPGKEPAFENVPLKSEDETAPRESSSACKDSSASFQHEKSVDAKITGDLGDKSSSCNRSSTSLSDSSTVSVKRRDERIVTSERTAPQNNSSDTNPQNADLVSDAEEEPSVSKKKSPFDLRQRIAERRLLRTGKANISRTVQQFPSRSKNVNEPFVRVSSMEACQNQSYAQRQIFNRHPFYRRKATPRRSVILRQSH